MNELKEIRLSLNMSQEEASKLLNMSRKTYIKYEQLEDLNDEKLNYYIYKFKQSNMIDETHGILTIDFIKKGIEEVFKNYDIKLCYLFGSYAKGKATQYSDVDLLIDSEITGLDFYGLIEDLREKLHKKIDLLTLKSLSNNAVMLTEILKDGIKIYG